LKDPSTLLLRVKDRVAIEIHATVDLPPEKPAAAVPSAAKNAGSP
jgi:hypothetical protein